MFFESCMVLMGAKNQNATIKNKFRAIKQILVLSLMKQGIFSLRLINYK